MFLLALLLIVAACGQSEPTTTEGPGGSSSTATTNTTVDPTLTTIPDTTTTSTATTTTSTSTTTTTVPKTKTTSGTTPPQIFITITTPKNGQVFEDRIVRFAGKTLPGAVVTIGPFRQVAVSGSWSFDLVIGPPAAESTFVFTAVDSAGNKATASVRVIYAPVQVTITTTTTMPSSTTTTLEPSP